METLPNLSNDGNDPGRGEAPEELGAPPFAVLTEAMPPQGSGNLITETECGSGSE